MTLKTDYQVSNRGSGVNEIKTNLKNCRIEANLPETKPLHETSSGLLRDKTELSQGKMSDGAGGLAWGGMPFAFPAIPFELMTFIVL